MRPVVAALLLAAACGDNPAFIDTDATTAATTGSSSSSGSSSSDTTAAPTTTLPATTTTGSDTTAAPTTADATTTGQVDPDTTTTSSTTTTTDETSSSTTADETTSGETKDSECPEKPSLVACYPFPAAQTDTLIDGSGDGHHGSVAGVQLVPSHSPEHGTAGQFKGAMSSAHIDHDDAFITDKLTVALFVKLDPGLVLGPRYLLDKAGRFGLIVEGDAITCHMRGAGLMMQTVTRTVPVDQWIHVSCVFDGANMRLVVYPEVDIQEPPKSLTGPLDDSGLPIGVGRSSAQTLPIVALLDTILFFERSLPDKELCDLAGPQLCPR
jgi:hypothetical protein